MLTKDKRMLRSFSFDVTINIIANLIPVFILQIVLQPIIAAKLGAENNGLFVTMLALLHFVVPVTSSALCNSRLLLNDQYKGEKGDFNIYLLFFSFINFLVVVGGGVFYISNASAADILLLSSLSLIWMLKDYLIVDFRIKLNYTNILINNIVLSIGFLLGLFFFYFFELSWYVIFLLGYLFSLIHVLIKTNLINEPIKKTPLYSKLKKTIWPIIFANLFGLLAVNFDRLFLYPLVGGALVSIYYSASIIGKLISLVSSPVSTVFLSYIVKLDVITTKKLNIIYLIVLSSGVAFYVICLLLSPFLLKMLYPLWAEESMLLVPITSAIAVFDLIISVTNPIPLRFGKINYQIVIQLTYLVVYILMGFLFYNLFGLLGFALGVLVASFVKALFIYIIARKSSFVKKCS